jgi:2,4-dienoyl-CoA reductase-like NADH-dependent reductase (Old Yellow Enzyme family)
MIEVFVQATVRANAAGFDIVELHSAHGYLMHQFLSPLSNTRTDLYGGDFSGRTRFHHELVEAVRGVWPAGKPLFMRLSVTDWVEEGWRVSDSVELAKSLKSLGVDLVDCSSGGTTADAQIPVGPGYQVHLAEAVKEGGGILTGAVGQITEVDQAEAILAEGRADLVFLGREALRSPYWANIAARGAGVDAVWPDQYSWAVG